MGASKSEEPTRNGLIAMTDVFVVTMVVNTMTTLTIILTGSYLQTQEGQGLEGGEQPHQYPRDAKAFNTVFPLGIGDTIVAIASILFGCANLIGLIILAGTVAAITKERLQGDERRGTGGNLLTLNTDRYTLA